LKNVSDVVIDSFSARQGLKDGNDAAILMEHVSDIVIRNSRATEGTNSFIHLQGQDNKNITLRYNDTKKAKKEISFSNEGLKKSVTIIKA
jgi:hypothetical protein